MNQRRRDPEPFGIVLIHGSAVIMEQRALIFLGPSGAGKSTISRILEPFASTIGDDKLYLIPRSHDWTVADATTRAWKGVLNEKEARSLSGTPLGAVFRLFQSPESRIVPVATRQTCRYLSVAFYELEYWSCHLIFQAQKAAFSSLANVSRRTPGFDLYFRESVEVVEEIRQAIKGLSTMS